METPRPHNPYDYQLTEWCRAFQSEPGAIKATDFSIRYSMPEHLVNDMVNNLQVMIEDGLATHAIVAAMIFGAWMAETAKERAA
jgi:hypothetical protein